MTHTDEAVRDAIDLGLFLRRQAQVRRRLHLHLFPEDRRREGWWSETYRQDMRDAIRAILRAKYWRKQNAQVFRPAPRRNLANLSS